MFCDKEFFKGGKIGISIMTTDLTFITNEPKANLLERFRALIKDTKFF
jgi:hypothetical protein